MVFFLFVIAYAIVAAAVSDLPIIFGESDVLTSQADPSPWIEWAGTGSPHSMVSLSHINGDQSDLPILIEGDLETEEHNVEGRDSKNDASSPRFIDRTFYKAQSSFQPMSTGQDATPSNSLTEQRRQTSDSGPALRVDNSPDIFSPAATGVDNETKSAEDPKRDIGTMHEKFPSGPLALPIDLPMRDSQKEDTTDLSNVETPVVKQEAEQSGRQRKDELKQDQDIGNDPTKIAFPGTVLKSLISAADPAHKVPENDRIVVAIDDFGHVKSYYPGISGRPNPSDTESPSSMSQTVLARPPTATLVRPNPLADMALSAGAQQAGKGYKDEKPGLQSYSKSLPASRLSQGVYSQYSAVLTPIIELSSTPDMPLSLKSYTSTVKAAAGNRYFPLYPEKEDRRTSITKTAKASETTRDESTVIGRPLPKSGHATISADYMFMTTPSSLSSMSSMSSLSSAGRISSSASHAVFDPTVQVKLPNGSWSPSCKNVRNGLYCLQADGNDPTVIECSGENIGYQFLCGDDLLCYSLSVGDVDCRQKQIDIL